MCFNSDNVCLYLFYQLTSSTTSQIYYIMCKYKPINSKCITLSELTLSRIREQRCSKLKIELALTLGLSVNSINRLFRDNSPNSFLTTFAAIEVIGNALDLPASQVIDVKFL